MIKPDWNNAPEWANWWATDYNGSNCYFETKPEKLKLGWLPASPQFEECDVLNGFFEDWFMTLMKRPQSPVTEAKTVTIELTPTELSILVTALGYATGNIDLDAVQPLQRKLLETYKEVNNAR